MSFLSYWPFYYAGCFFLISFIIDFCLSIFPLFYRKYCPIDWEKTYGKGSYVGITGGSDGIGLAFAKFYASKGFNLVLIARNFAKLERVASEIKKENENVKIKIIVCDFSQASKSGFFDQAIEQLSNLDISIFINCVGITLLEELFRDNFLDRVPLAHLLKAITINTIPQTVFHQKLFSQLEKRKFRSAIIDLSSLSADSFLPPFEVYSATKAFNDYLSVSRGSVLSNTHTLSWKPGLILTSLNSKSEFRNFKMPFALNPDEAVFEALKALGLTKSTCGMWGHTLIYFGGLIGAWLGDLAPFVKPLLAKSIEPKKNSQPDYHQRLI